MFASHVQYYLQWTDEYKCHFLGWYWICYMHIDIANEMSNYKKLKLKNELCDMTNE